MDTTISELVDCNFRVSPALARRFKKATLAEQTGQDAHGALMIAAGYKPDEVDLLRTQVEGLSSDLDGNEHDQSLLKASVDELRADLSQTRKQLEELKSAKKRIAALEETLAHSVETRNLPNKTAEKIGTMVDAILSGSDPQTTFFAAADYDRGAVDEALTSMGPLMNAKNVLEDEVTPLREVLASGGIKAKIVRRILGLS